MTVYWILPLFWDDGKLEFDCTNNFVTHESDKYTETHTHLSMW